MLPTLDRRHYFWLFCALVIALIYSPSLHGPYILDDSHTLSSNGFVQSYSNFTTIWSTGRAYSSLPANYGYRPFTTTMNMVLWSIGDGATWPYHAAKIILFFLTCWLLGKLWSVLFPKVPREVIGAAVFLFAVNPVHSQVVSYISAIATQWAALFVCLSVLFYLKFRQSSLMRFHVFSLLSALLAILSKEEGVVVVALIPLLEIYLRKRENSALLSTARIGALAAYLIPMAVGVGLIVYMFEPLQNLVRSNVSMGSYFMTQWRAYLRYFAMYFYSYDLNADNIAFGFSRSFLERSVLLALALNVLFLVVAVGYWKRLPALTFALMWFYIGVSPASSIVVLSEPVNDHRAFIGYMGFAAIGILLLNALRAKNRTAFLVVVCAVGVVYSAMTYKRAEAWSTNENLWEDTVAKNPLSPRAYNNLSLDHMRQRRYEDALALLKRCSELQPTYHVCHINSAIVLSQLGKDDRAEQEFALSAQYDPSVVQSRYNWAKFLLARGHFARAQSLLTEADTVAQGQNLEVRMELISAVRQQGDRELAKKLFQEAVSVFGWQPRFNAEAQRLGLAP